MLRMAGIDPDPRSLNATNPQSRPRHLVSAESRGDRTAVHVPQLRLQGGTRAIRPILLTR